MKMKDINFDNGTYIDFCPRCLHTDGNGEQFFDLDTGQCCSCTHYGDDECATTGE